MSDSEDEIVKVENGNPKQKNISLKNIKPVKGIKVIREDISSDSDLSDSSSLSSYTKPKKTKKVLRRKEPPVEQSSQFQRQQYTSHNNNFSEFSNPKKVSVEQRNVPADAESNYESDSDQSQLNENNGEENENGESSESQKTKMSYEEKQKVKQDLLIKIQGLKQKGFEFSKEFTMQSNYEEMLFEYNKIKSFIETQSSVKFARKCLIFCISALEKGHKKFNPFKLNLNGWTGNVADNISDYDDVFERLHEKWGNKAEMSPEVELLLLIGSSAFMFHLQGQLAKVTAGVMGNGSGVVAQNNTNFMTTMLGAMSQGMKQANIPPTGAQMVQEFQQQSNPFPQPQVSIPQPHTVDIRNHLDMRQAAFPKPIETRTTGRQEMRGPSIDQNLFNGTPLANHPSATLLQVPNVGGPPPPQRTNVASQPIYYDDNINDDDRYSIASSDSSLTSMSDTKSITVKKRVPTRKGKAGKAAPGGFELNIG